MVNCSLLFTKLNLENKDKFLETANKISKISKSKKRILQCPFPYSHNYNSWYNAFYNLLWLGIFYKKCLKDKHFSPDNEILEELNQNLGYVDNLIKNTKFNTIDPNMSELIESYSDG